MPNITAPSNNVETARTVVLNIPPSAMPRSIAILDIGAIM